MNKHLDIVLGDKNKMHLINITYIFMRPIYVLFILIKQNGSTYNYKVFIL